MPVRRGGDDDGLEAGGGQEFLVVLARLGPGALHLLDGRGGVRQVLAVHVTQGDDLDAAGLEGGPHIGHTVVAAPDHTEPQLGLIRRRRAR